MKKLLTVGIILLSAITLSACGNDKSTKPDTSSHVSSKVKKTSAEDKAKIDVDSLFDNSEHTKLLDGTTSETIADIKNEVNNLKSSDTKTKLLADVKKANELWPKFKKNMDQENSVKNSKMNSKASLEEASEEASSSRAESESKKKAVEESSKAASSSVAEKEYQAEYRKVVINNVKEMHGRMDDYDGIAAKVKNLSDHIVGHTDEIKKEIKVLDNVITECEDKHVQAEDLADSDVDLVNKANEFWDLSQEILKDQKQLLKFCISEADKMPNSKTYSNNVDKWTELYNSISKL